MADDDRTAASILSEAIMVAAGEVAGALGVEEGHVFVMVCTPVDIVDRNHYRAITSMQAGLLSGDPDKDGLDTANKTDIVNTLLIHVRNACADVDVPITILPGPVGQG